MKQNILIVVFFILFTSCSTTYYYSTMNTDNPYTRKTENGRFSIDGDSLDIYYSFNGENCPIIITIKNKSSQTLYVDWRKSGTVIDSLDIPYLPEYGTDKGIEFNNDNPFRINVDIDGISAVLPQDSISMQWVELAGLNFSKINKKEFKYSWSEIYKTNKKENYPAIFYTTDDSPIYLNTYLTVYLSKEKYNSPLLYESSFYMSKLFNAGRTSPKNIPSYANEVGAIFFTKKETGYKFWKKVGNIAVSTIFIMIETYDY